MSAFAKIATTIRLSPRTLAILSVGMRKLSINYGKFRSPASVVKTACDILEELITQKFPELAAMNEAEMAAALVGLNSLDNSDVHRSVATVLSAVMPDIDESVIPDDTVCELPSQHLIQKTFKIPDNFLTDEDSEKSN